jgi:hypothetical protein
LCVVSIVYFFNVTTLFKKIETSQSIGDTTMAFPVDAAMGAGNFAPARTAVGDMTAGGVTGLNKLWLPLWSGEVIHAYDQFNLFESLITNKPLSGGVSYDFPITGTVALNESWDAGEELAGGTSATNTFKVTLDKRPMAAHFETDNIDALITQWDYRSELARQAGMRLANTRDRQLAESICVAAILSPLGFNHTAGTGSTTDPRGLTQANFPPPAVVSTVNTGANQASVTATTEAAALGILQAIEDYFVFMQQNDYPCMNVVCCVTPKTFQVIRSLGLARAGDTTVTTAGGNFTKLPMFAGSSEYGGLGAPYSVGLNAMTDSLEYMGCRIIKSNHLPGGQDYSASPIGSSKYNLKWSTGPDIFGVIFQQEAVAGLSLMGMKVDSVQDVRRNTQFTVASMMKGTGVLRPELCQLLIGLNSVTTVDTTAEVDTRYEVNAIINTASSSNLANGFNAEYAATSTY